MGAPLRVRRPAAHELHAVAGLLDAHLGVIPGRAGFLADGHAAAHAQLLVAGDDRGLLGAGMALRYPRERAHLGLPAGREGVARELLDAHPAAGEVGYLDVLATVPAARQHGIGGRLLDAHLRWLDAHAPVTFALAWERSDIGAQASGLLAARGFRVARHEPCFWQGTVPGNSDNCPACGPRCRCAALIMVRAGA